jgi:protein-disulfide isomerase
MPRLDSLVSFALVACLFDVACTSQAATPPPARTAGGKPSFDEPPAPAAPTPAAAAPVVAAAPAPAPGGATGCDAARLALDPTAVVARYGETELRASDLGPDLAKAETAALRTYCDAVANMRKQAVDAAIDERLLDQAAKDAGFSGTGTAWLQAEVAKTVPQPTDDEIQAFYDANKTPTAPPLDQVKDQVIAAMIEEPTQVAISTVLGDLRKKVAVQTMLPDVASPPMEIPEADFTAGFGPKDAKVHVVEFSDFECPYCARAAGAVSGLKAKYGDRVRFSYRHFPLSFHPNARPAAEMAQCAQAQDKFWEFHDAVFASTDGIGPDALRKAAETAGLDSGKLDACLASGEPGKQIDVDMKLASEVGVSGTPNFFLNGRPFEGAPAALAAAIEAELNRG